ncbi:D-isomer specific 2-hydroxyacid dehydrogenase family protein [soil metagenome]
MIVASQFAPSVNAGIAVRLPDAVIRAVPIGYDAPDLLEADVFLHSPDIRPGARLPAAPPPGWPGRLRLIQLITTGTDFYADWLFSGPPVASAVGLSGPPISEYCLAAIFAAARDMPGIWMKGAEDYTRRMAGSVRGSRLGIYGFGSIGRTLAAQALLLGMRVVAVRGSTAPLGMAGVEQAADMKVLIADCDHLVLAAPATPATRHIVDARALAVAKPGLHLINVARGGLVDQDALIAALDDGTLSRATLDVTEPEPLPTGHLLYTHPRVFLSPHVSASGQAYLDGIEARAADNIGRLARGEALVGLVAR